MDVLYWIIKLFIWAIALAFSTIPGMIMGCFGEILLGSVGYWIGFAFGVLAFLFYVGPMLAFNDDKKPQTRNQNPRHFPLLSFLGGLWLGSKFKD